MLKTNKKPQLWFSCYEKAFVFTTGLPGKSQELFLRCQLPVALQKVQVWERVPTCANADVSWVLVPLTSGFFLQLLGLYPVFGTSDPPLQASVMIRLAFWVPLDPLLPSGPPVPSPQASHWPSEDSISHSVFHPDIAGEHNSSCLPARLVP